jgi:hypothetical protein
LFGKCVSRREDNIKTDSKAENVKDSAGSGYGPVVGFCEHYNEHWNSIKFSQEELCFLW